MNKPTLKITKFDNEDVIATSISFLRTNNGIDLDAVFTAAEAGKVVGTIKSSSDNLVVYSNNGALYYPTYTKIYLFPSLTAETGATLSTLIKGDVDDAYSSYNGYYTYIGQGTPTGKTATYYIFRKNQ